MGVAYWVGVAFHWFIVIEWQLYNQDKAESSNLSQLQWVGLIGRVWPSIGSLSLSDSCIIKTKQNLHTYLSTNGCGLLGGCGLPLVHRHWVTAVQSSQYSQHQWLWPIGWTWPFICPSILSDSCTNLWQSRIFTLISTPVGVAYWVGIAFHLSILI